MTELEIIVEILKYYGAICIGCMVFMTMMLVVRKAIDRNYRLMDGILIWFKSGLFTYFVIIPVIVIVIIGLVCVVGSVLWAFGLL